MKTKWTTTTTVRGSREVRAAITRAKKAGLLVGEPEKVGRGTRATLRWTGPVPADKEREDAIALADRLQRRAEEIRATLSPVARDAVERGARLVAGGIHMPSVSIEEMPQGWAKPHYVELPREPGQPARFLGSKGEGDSRAFARKHGLSQETAQRKAELMGGTVLCCDDLPADRVPFRAYARHRGYDMSGLPCELHRYLAAAQDAEAARKSLDRFTPTP